VPNRYLSENGSIGEFAAQYVRMSKDEQDYSTFNQEEAIAAYAFAHNFKVIHTYRDEGRSGLLFDSRPGLKQLLDDVQSGHANFTAILVYDVSRWGRFQDVDEGAYYEQLCKRAGVRVIFCAEEFENDGSLVSTLLKAMQRVEAAKYSRRLSVKVFAGQCNLVRRGFWQGAAPGYGLRRALIDANGSPKTILAQGERKYIQSDRVILVPGPPHEIETVRRVFESFVSEQKSTTEIAAELNSEGITNGYGRLWTKTSVRKVLTSEKYVGTNLFNRCSMKLKGKVVRNAPEQWIRVEGAFEAIVDRPLFAAAQKIGQKNRCGISNEEMLGRLAVLFAQMGHLSCKIINEAEGLPHSTLYRTRFGKLSSAYEQIGYQQKGSSEYRAIKRALADRFAEIAEGVTADIKKAGMAPLAGETASTFKIGSQVFSLFVVRHAHTATKCRAWVIRSSKGFGSDRIIAVRMDRTNWYPLDYLLLPTKLMHPHRINLAIRNFSLFEPYRFQSIDALVTSIGALVASSVELDPGLDRQPDQHDD